MATQLIVSNIVADVLSSGAVAQLEPCTTEYDAAFTAAYDKAFQAEVRRAAPPLEEYYAKYYTWYYSYYWNVYFGVGDQYYAAAA